MTFISVQVTAPPSLLIHWGDRIRSWRDEVPQWTDRMHYLILFSWMCVCVMAIWLYVWIRPTEQLCELS